MVQLTEAGSNAPDERIALEARCERLQALVVELLHANQELRLKLEVLERRTESAERALSSACAWAAMLAP